MVNELKLGNWKINEITKLTKWIKQGYSHRICAARLNRPINNVKKMASRSKIRKANNVL